MAIWAISKRKKIAHPRRHSEPPPTLTLPSSSPASQAGSQFPPEDVSVGSGFTHPYRSPLSPVEEPPVFQSPLPEPYIPYSASLYDPSDASFQQLPPSPPLSPPMSPPLSRPRSPSRSSLKPWKLHSLAQQFQHRRPKCHSCTDFRSPGSQTSTEASCNSADPSGVHPWDDSMNLSDLISGKLDEVITLIDAQSFSGMETDLAVGYNHWQPSLRGGDGKRASGRSLRAVDRGPTMAPATGTNYFSKVYHYANSRLPPFLPPLKLYIGTYPLLCLASQYSQRVYTDPFGPEKETHVQADWRSGAKAMVIKSVPLDNANVIVFAIRGTHTFKDWTININEAPTAPHGFLDDVGNLCHAGFLSVARRMVKPVASRLRQLLRENPTRASYSLLIAGHSAGGAVANLLFAHLLSEKVESELIHLRDCFKRVHCVTFGTPPVSILPITKPANPKFQKWLFFSFVNEGDPVPRAEKAYIRSLVDLYISPAPPGTEDDPNAPLPKNNASLKFSLLGGKQRRRSKEVPEDEKPKPIVIWNTPPSMLCPAGRLILLRGSRRNTDHVEACLLSDEDLRQVVFGDPMMHAMDLYARRVELLAKNAVTARGGIK